jgi:very-short-patch-repair endonuclease
MTDHPFPGGRVAKLIEQKMRKRKISKSIASKPRHNQTDAEKALWTRLRSKQLKGVKFRRQQPIGTYIVDLISFDSRLIIEIDGSQHSQDNKTNKDEKRTMWLQQRGYQVIRFWDNEVLQNIDGVLEKILAALK